MYVAPGPPSGTEALATEPSHIAEVIVASAGVIRGIVVLPVTLQLLPSDAVTVSTTSAVPSAVYCTLAPVGVPVNEPFAIVQAYEV